ncbi:MAG: sugar ABC transporter ATP-binding protein [Byssovorax sp.]
MLLSIAGLGKSFGGTAALGGVDLEASAGEIHAVVGENGAGKSTLMKILAGVMAPDTGAIRLGDAPYRPRNPLEARRAGVAMVYQELSLCPHLTVAENILLGVEPTRNGLLRRGEMARIAARAMGSLLGDAGQIAPDAIVGELPPATRQLVEIARALAHENPRVLILDEPTSSLGRDEAARLFEVVRALAERGLCVLYISHFLEEVQALAHRYTVLRDGRSVATGLTSETTPAEIVTKMAGRRLDALYPRTPRTAGEAVLDVTDLVGADRPRKASLTLHRGEVLGIAGLVGAGRTELLRALFGLDPITSGKVRLKAFVGPASPARRLAQGMDLLSEDRKAEGLAGALSIADNLTLSDLPRFISSAWQRATALRWIEALGIRSRDPQQPIGDLSGGNQQKVALARLLHHDADVFLLDEPTRGIDVGAKAQIYEVIDREAAKGKAILMVSSYLPELLGVCDRIAVMTRGRLGEAKPVAARTEHEILLEATAG